MKKLAISVAVLAAVCGAWAQSGSGRNYNQEGKQFGQGQLNTQYNKIKTTDPKSVPYYNENPPQKQSFGAANLFDVGVSRIQTCKVAGSTGDKMADQECAAVNFLAKNPRAHFDLSSNDPALGSFQNALKDAGKWSDKVTESACATKTIETPAEYADRACAEYLEVSNKQCTQGWVVNVNADANFQCDQTYKATEILTCEKTLYTACSKDGAVITDLSTKNSGLFNTVTIVPNSGKTGLYDYTFDRTRICGTEGWAEIDFNLDEIGTGSYLTLNLSNLDDTAAVAVNDFTVFAGYPNSGPQYSGDWFRRDNPAFQLGYQWTEQIGQTCTNWDTNGDSSYCTAYAPRYMTFTSNAKLLDYCPAGYGITQQKDLVYCDGESGQCSTPDPYSPNNLPGFFCNAEGKFLINRREGKGTWGGSVSTTMPLKVGKNKIVVYWGTGNWGGACGNVHVAGQIYNVKQQCTDQWTDNCADLEARTK